MAGVQRAEKKGGVELERDEATSGRALLASASAWWPHPHMAALPLPKSGVHSPGWALLLGEVGIRCRDSMDVSSVGQGTLDGGL